jgi:hypothetical protein
MIVSAVAGGAGAAATGAAKGGSMAGMEGMSVSSSNPGWVNVINSIGQPLLIVSLLLIVLGLLPRGWLPTAFAIVGSVLFYGFMFIHYSLPLAILAGVILLTACGVAFLPRRVSDLRAEMPGSEAVTFRARPE